MRKELIVAAVAAALSPAAVSADDIDYSFVELQYLSVDPDPGASADGFQLGGSFEVGSNFHVLADFVSLDGLDGYDVGFGYHTDGEVSFYAELAYLSFDPDIGGSLDGYGLEVGARGMLTPQLEWQAGVGYEDLDVADETSLGLGLRYHLNEDSALGLEVGFGDDTTSWGLGYRYSFGD